METSDLIRHVSSTSATKYRPQPPQNENIAPTLPKTDSKTKAATTASTELLTDRLSAVSRRKTRPLSIAADPPPSLRKSVSSPALSSRRAVNTKEASASPLSSHPADPAPVHAVATKDSNRKVLSVQNAQPVNVDSSLASTGTRSYKKVIEPVPVTILSDVGTEGWLTLSSTMACELISFKIQSMTP